METSATFGAQRPGRSGGVAGVPVRLKNTVKALRVFGPHVRRGLRLI